MTEHHSGDEFVTSNAFVEHARDLARTLEDREAARSQLRLVEARPIVARRLGTAPGTLENLRNGRLKTIAAHVYAALRQAVVGELEKELRHLEHELHLLRQTGSDPRGDEAAAVVSDIAKVRSALSLPPILRSIDCTTATGVLPDR